MILQADSYDVSLVKNIIVVELKEKNSILDRDLNPGLSLYMLVLSPLSYPRQVRIQTEFISYNHPFWPHDRCSYHVVWRHAFSNSRMTVIEKIFSATTT